MTYEERLVEVCPQHEEAARHVAQTVFRINNCQPEDVARKIVLADKLGLDLTLPNQFSIVVRGNRATHVIGWVGVRDMAMRTGQYDIVSSYLVHEGDHFECDLAQGVLSHKPKSFDEGPVIGAYAFSVHTKTGRYDIERMSVVELNKVRDSVSGWRKTPWGNWEGEMQRKSVLKRLGKRLGFSKEDQRALKQEDDETEWVRQSASEPVEPSSDEAEWSRNCPTDAAREPVDYAEVTKEASARMAEHVKTRETLEKHRDIQKTGVELKPDQPAIDEKPRFQDDAARKAARDAIRSLEADGHDGAAAILGRHHPAFLRTVESIQQALDDALEFLNPSDATTLEDDLREAGDNWFEWFDVLSVLPGQTGGTVDAARKSLFGAVKLKDITLEQAIEVAGELLG